MKRLSLLNTACSLLAAATLAAQPAPAPASPDEEVVTMEAFRVEAEAEKDHYVQGPFLPAVQGTKINVGKKTTIIDLDSLPRITGNNYRQALTLTPGLIISEETTPLLSIGYRGLNPNRVQFMQVLKDGIPIHADQFGYPESYYTPPLDTVDRIEFTRGGAALMYGPQPGGALNYVTHRPRPDRRLSGETLQTFGSDNYYSTFTYLDGTAGPLGYYGYYNHRETDGFRSGNSDVQLDAYLGRVVVNGDSANRWIFTAESYAEEHGEPGGLTFSTAPGAMNYNTQRNAASRLFDRFVLQRKAASAVWEHDFERGTVSARAWVIDYVRASRRQNGGGFGTLPTGAAAGTNTIERQQLTTYGAEARVRLDWRGHAGHVFTAGAQYFHTDSPRTDSRGAAPGATAGATQTKSRRFTTYAPVFAENLFRFGPLSLTPGLRVENARQEVREEFNAAKQAAGTPLGHGRYDRSVVLGGLAAAWDFPRKTQAYANFSESYRPLVFTQAVPTGGTAVVNADLKEGRAQNYELGLRGQPWRGLVFDASVFRLDFDDQIGNVSLPGGRSTVGNIGRAVHQGLEVSVQYRLLGRNERAPAASLDAFANATLLRARFESGPLAGFTPQLAPRHVVRSGLTYSRGDRLKASLLGTFSAASFGDDNTTAERALPAYATLDLIFEAALPRTPLRVTGGINNLLDEDYYSRVANTGIDPAPRRNYYLGLSLGF
jgi:Fe(3+) dicitrate transport protein